MMGQRRGIDNPNRRTVFLLGAGFSKAVHQTMPITRDIPELLENLTLEIPCEFITRDFKKDFETWLSTMASQHAWEDECLKMRRMKAFHQVLIGLSKVFIGKMNRAFRESQWTDETDECSWLHLLFRFWDDHQSSILTFNYDTLIEHRYFAFRNPRHFRTYSPPPHYPQKIEFFPRDSGNQIKIEFNQPRFQLFKLHGSINWWRRFPPNNDDQKVYFWDRPIGRWRKADRNEHNFSMGIEYTSDEVDLVPLAYGCLPFIVPPVATKDSFYQVPVLDSIWKDAAEKLRQASMLVVMGYSFPKSDQSAITFFHNLNRGARVVVVDKCPSAAGRACEVFGPLGIPVEQAPLSDFAVSDYCQAIYQSP